MKYCTNCKTDKEESLFYKNKNRKDFLDIWCKECTKKRNKKYYEDNKEKVLLCNKKYKLDNEEYCKRYKVNNKEKGLFYKKKYYENNKEKVLTCNKKYREKNKEKINIHKLEYISIKYKTDIQFKLQRALRTRLASAIKGNFKTGSAVRDLGCSIPQLKEHLEQQWTEGMSWDNWSKDGWHIDHVKPLASFVLEDPTQLLKAINYKNLQPLWAIDNIIKSDNL